MKHKRLNILIGVLAAVSTTSLPEANAQTRHEGTITIEKTNGQQVSIGECEISNDENGLRYTYGGTQTSVNADEIKNVRFNWQIKDAIPIDYKENISEADVKAAYKNLHMSFVNALNGIYSLRGGKEGGAPEAHAYQIINIFGPDCYVQYFCIPHSDFPYSNATVRSTYDLCKQFIGGPACGFQTIKRDLAPVLQSEEINKLPELKAIYLLFYDYAAIENIDLFGPATYYDGKNLKEENPFYYDDVRSIYYEVANDIDKIVDCLAYYKDNRPKYYKETISKALQNYVPLLKDYDTDALDAWIHFANSLKLRMAIHMSKIEPSTAKKWAEEAVANGVIDDTAEEIAIRPSTIGIDHPLVPIIGWGDVVMGASFINLLQNLHHPYMSYLFTKNSVDLTRSSNAVAGSSAPTTTANGSVYVGMRNGVTPGEGQAVSYNPYCGYSVPDKYYIVKMQAPLYFMKLSEVCFLRAEGALRGWNMGGSAKSFYEKGIRYAGLEARENKDAEYKDYVNKYLNVEKPSGEKYVDPQGLTPDMTSVTSIGVKWNEGDSQETKLQKIITQKYIASFPYSYEALVDLRRTGYPKLFPILNPQDGDGSLGINDEKVQTSDNIIRRIPWCSDDPQTKEDLERTGLPALGGEDLQGTRLWWDVDAPNF